MSQFYRFFNYIVLKLYIIKQGFDEKYYKGKNCYRITCFLKKIKNLYRLFGSRKSDGC